MDLKDVLRSGLAARAIDHVVDRAIEFNREDFPLTIKEIGIGGSSLRVRNPKDIDIVVRAEVKNTPFNRGFINGYLRQGWSGKEIEFHTAIAGHSVKIPHIILWSDEKGFLDLNEQEVEKLSKKEFQVLQNLIKRIDTQSLDAPAFRPSMNLLKGYATNEFDLKLRRQVFRSLDRMHEICLNQQELPQHEVNTLLRSELKKFALFGLIAEGLKCMPLFDEEKIAEVLNKKYGIAKNLKSIFDDIDFQNAKFNS
jgi:predicted nucleotidyltransferase